MKNNLNLAVFKPSNARLDNAFYSGQYPIFKMLQENNICEVTFFLDDESIEFVGIKNKYIKKRKFRTFIYRILRKIFNIQYIKLPYYGSLDFSEYDVLITEGFHYHFLKYFENYKGKLIINDSITNEKMIKNLDAQYINSHFSKAIVVVVNNKIKALYKKYGIKVNTVVIGHALQLDKILFQKRNQFNGKLVSVGRLVEEKGYIYIFQAIKKLIVKYPYLRLDIYGRGYLELILRQYVLDSHLEDHIFFKGFVKYDLFLNKLSGYDLFISHPLEMDYIAEAFHMANMEAMASGLPIITSDCGGVPSVVKDKAIVVEQKNVQKIAESIEMFIKNKKLMTQMSLTGREYVEETYSLDIIYKQWKYLIL